MTGALHLCFAARGPYLRLSAASLASALANAGMPVHVHYLHPADADPADLEALGGMTNRAGARIDLHPIPDEQVGELPASAEFTSAMWYRILLPDLLPDLDRILYLDVDTLVLDSLRPLWETDLAGYVLAAVSNVFQHNHVDRPRRLGIPPAQTYFNSGVLLMNLEQMRRTDARRAIVECAVERGPELEWPDQDALNLVLGPGRLPLEPRWNCMNSVVNFEAASAVFDPEQLERAREQPAIRHFEGPGANKPWDPGCTDPLRPIFLEHMSRTPWPDWRPTRRPRGGPIRRAMSRLRPGSR